MTAPTSQGTPQATAPKLVSLTIDDRSVAVPEGSLVIKAAETLGITVPHFCYHERLKPIAACRLCLVEIEGMRGLQASCATPVKEGMIVRTTSAPSTESHKEVLDLVLENHPLDCGKCEAAGRCQLEDFTYEFGPHRVSNYNPPGISGIHYQEVPWSPLLKFDPFKCVECTRCIRVCDEVHDCRALTAEGRGHNFTITTFANGPLHCDFCGSCASVCPTGAIEQQPARFFKKDWEYEKRPAVCTHCAHGCSLVLRTWDESIQKVDDDIDLGINRANLCAKGRFGFDMLDVPDRIRMPLVRDGEGLREVGWEEALQAASDLIEDAQSHNRAIAGIASGTISIEDLQAFGGLLDALKAPRLAESRDGDVTRRLAAATGVFGSTITYDQIGTSALGTGALGKFPVIAVAADLESLDYVAHIDLQAAARFAGRKIIALGAPYARLKPYVSESRPYTAESIAALPAGTLFILDAEHVPSAVLDAVASRLKTRSESGDGLLLVAAQANSRAFGPMGFSVVGDLRASLLLVAGPVEMATRPANLAGLVVSAHHRGGIVEEADVVFPAAFAYERPGTYVNSEGRRQFAAAAARPVGVAWPDGAIWSRLARACGIETPQTPQALRAAADSSAPALAGSDPLLQGAVSTPSGSLLATRLSAPSKHTGLLLAHSAWTKTLRDHLDSSREFAPWPE